MIKALQIMNTVFFSMFDMSCVRVCDNLLSIEGTCTVISEDCCAVMMLFVNLQSTNYDCAVILIHNYI